MSNRRLALLLFVFVVLMIAATSSLWLPSGGSRRESDDDRLGLAAHRESDVSSISMRERKGAVRVLERRNGSWTIGGVRVPREKITQLFDALADASDGELVSRSTANHAKFGVTAATGTTLDLQHGDSHATYVIGNTGSSQTTWYVARAGHREVYEVSGALRELAQQPASTWRAK